MTTTKTDQPQVCICGCGKPAARSWKDGRQTRYAAPECQIRMANRRKRTRKVKRTRETEREGGSR